MTPRGVGLISRALGSDSGGGAPEDESSQFKSGFSRAMIVVTELVGNQTKKDSVGGKGAAVKNDMVVARSPAEVVRVAGAIPELERSAHDGPEGLGTIEEGYEVFDALLVASRPGLVDLSDPGVRIVAAREGNAAFPQSFAVGDGDDAGGVVVGGAGASRAETRIELGDGGDDRSDVKGAKIDDDSGGGGEEDGGKSGAGGGESSGESGLDADGEQGGSGDGRAS